MQSCSTPDVECSLVESTKYDPWGEVNVGGTASKFQYTGQEKDTETGLHYYGARYYDPHIRRFTQADPVIQNVFDPQMLNRYSYVRNNPLRYTDPTGNETNALKDAGLWSLDLTSSSKANYGFQSVGGSFQPLVKAQETPTNGHISAPISYVKGLTALENNSVVEANNKSYSLVSSASVTTNLSTSISINTGNTGFYRPRSGHVLFEDGYVDIGVSTTIYGPVGVGLGWQISKEGITPYVLAGVMTRGNSGNITYVPGNVKENSTSVNLSLGYGGALNYSHPFESFNSDRIQQTLGVSNPGASLTINQTGYTKSWSEIISLY